MLKQQNIISILIIGLVLLIVACQQINDPLAAKPNADIETFAAKSSNSSSLIVGSPREDINGILNAGVVTSFSGATAGLDPKGGFSWSQDDAGIPGVIETDDEFGRWTAAGDFDGDGLVDVVVGIPKDDLLNIEDAGTVIVTYGNGNPTQQWYQGLNGLFGTPEVGEQFGTGLAVGDFNGDGYDELAISAPNDIVAGKTSGSVHVLYGSSQGLTASTNQLFNKDLNLSGTPDDGDAVGWALTAGDFNGDTYDDLVISLLTDDVGNVQGVGKVLILYGSCCSIATPSSPPIGVLNTTNSQELHQDSPGSGEINESDDQFGRTLAVGDFDGDTFDDLAVQIRLEDVTLDDSTTILDAGTVQVWYGEASGIGTRNDVFRQGLNGITGIPASYDWFGNALTTGDFNKDCYSDLVIGAYTDETIGIENAGAVHVIYGTDSGLSYAGDQFWAANSAGLNTSAEPNDYFGYSLSSGDYNGDGTDDLAIGVIGAGSGLLENAGRVQVIYGASSTGLPATSPIPTSLVQSHQGSSTFGADENFGWSLLSTKQANNCTP